MQKLTTKGSALETCLFLAISWGVYPYMSIRTENCKFCFWKFRKCLSEDDIYADCCVVIDYS